NIEVVVLRKVRIEREAEQAILQAAEDLEFADDRVVRFSGFNHADDARPLDEEDAAILRDRKFHRIFDGVVDRAVAVYIPVRFEDHLAERAVGLWPGRQRISLLRGAAGMERNAREHGTNSE